MSARLLAGAGAVLRREGLVRALDAAARRPLGDPGAVLGFVAVLVPRRGIFAPVGLGGHLGLEERVHRRVGLVGRALVVWIDRPTSRARGKKNSTFFKNMGYRGQSCDDWHMLMEFIDYPFPTGVCDADEVPRAVLD